MSHATFVHNPQCDPRLAVVADQISTALSAVDIEADGNPHALQFYAAVEWILAQDRTAEEKLRTLFKLSSLEGRVTVNMKALTGW